MSILIKDQKLSDSLTTDILSFLDCPRKAPTLRYLNRLIYAYIRKVPWESVSRIIKRHANPETKDCPRWPAEFWRDAIQHGFGGTCYESSLAFYGLLSTLGFEGYLTVNDMGDTIGCHAAVIVWLDGQKYLVDVTIPVHAAVRIHPQKTIRRKTAFLDFTIRPVRENVYQVERSHHPKRNAFTLIDMVVSLPDYRAIVTDDYQDATGRFLKSVVIVKVAGEKTVRFFSDLTPYKLESFSRGGKEEIMIEPERLPEILAGIFKMPEGSISAALACVRAPPIPFDLS
jgi:arylamine N-acetyltransferase